MYEDPTYVYCKNCRFFVRTVSCGEACYAEEKVRHVDVVNGIYYNLAPHSKTPREKNHDRQCVDYKKKRWWNS